MDRCAHRSIHARVQANRVRHTKPARHAHTLAASMRVCAHAQIYVSCRAVHAAPAVPALRCAWVCARAVSVRACAHPRTTPLRTLEYPVVTLAYRRVPSSAPRLHLEYASARENRLRVPVRAPIESPLCVSAPAEYRATPPCVSLACAFMPRSVPYMVPARVP